MIIDNLPAYKRFYRVAASICCVVVCILSLTENNTLRNLNGEVVTQYDTTKNKTALLRVHHPTARNNSTKNEIDNNVRKEAVMMGGTEPNDGLTMEDDGDSIEKTKGDENDGLVSNLQQELPPKQEEEPKHRWNTTQFKHWLEVNLNDTTSAFDKKVLFDHVPKPRRDHHDIQIYNRSAWHRLRGILLGLQQDSEANDGRPNNNKVVLCSSGGSITAGGGNVPSEDRYDSVMAQLLLHSNHNKTTKNTNNKKPKPPTIQVVNRGHGFRDSTHTAFLVNNFIPLDTDVLIWEFSVNDADGQAKGCDEINVALRVWLDQIQRRPGPLPLVILAYVWDPMARGRPTNLTFTSYGCHTQTMFAAQYYSDFVVGHVNLGSYMKHSDYDSNFLQRFILADQHHPNSLGHWLLGYMLYSFVVEEDHYSSQPNVRIAADDITTLTVTDDNKDNNIIIINNKPQWTCNSKNPNQHKQRINDILNEQYALASWTSELPRNQYDMQDGMIVPSTNNTSSLVKANGKASNRRDDRKPSLQLPCCSTTTKKERLGFDLTNITTITGGSNIHNNSTGGGGVELSAVLLHIPEAVKDHFEPYYVYTKYAKVKQSVHAEFLDSNGVVIASTSTTVPIVTFESGECRLESHYLSPWLLMPEGKKMMVSRINFCGLNCDKEGRSDASIMQVALF